MANKNCFWGLGAVLLLGAAVPACSPDEDPAPIIQSMKEEFATYEARSFDREKLRAEWLKKAGELKAALGTHHSEGADLSSLPDEKSLDDQMTASFPNQEHAGACKTFSNVASIEAAYFRKYGTVIKFSELWPLRLMIGEELLRNQPQGVSPGIYLGLNADEMLWWSRHAGFCLERSFDYSSGPIERFDSLFRSNKKDAERLTWDFLYFRDDLHLRGQSGLKACEAEFDRFKTELRGFEEIYITDGSSANLMRWIAFNIPVYYVVRGPGSADELVTPSPHAVLLTGYNRRLGKFYLRNSWGSQGQYETSRIVRFDRVDRENESDDAFFYSSTAVVSQADRDRACANLDEAPEELKYYCH